MASNPQRNDWGRGSQSGQSGQRGGGPGGRGNRGRGGPPPGGGGDVPPADSCVMPYHFVPVRPGLALQDDPVFHDVQQTGAGYVSGELHCTLTALTPLIAGSFQVEYRYVAEHVRQALDRLLGTRRASGTVDAAKKIIEPMRLDPPSGTVPGRLLIPGEALKGPIAQSLKSLLSAPMERVQERTFSFRPNLGDALCMRPAIVHSRRVENDRLVELEIEYALGGCEDIYYVCPEAEKTLQTLLASDEFGYNEAARGLDDLPVEAPRANIYEDVDGLRIDSSKRYAKKLRPGGRADLRDYVLVRYRGGLDGDGTFAESFDGKPPYRWALLKLPHAKKKEVVHISAPEVLGNYSDTLAVIADRTTGHLLRHPQRKLDRARVAEKIAWMRRNCPQPGDLIYVESVRGKIVAIGHHFRHRRIYRDSIHLSGDSGTPSQQRLRQVLCPKELERETQSDGIHAGAPQKLTAARGLFGYVAQQATGYENPDQPFTFGIGEAGSDFKQLAGRVSINWAVEDGDPERQGRFVNEGVHGCLVPLRPLSSPKPSAVETYLTQDKLDQRQDRGTLCTYGDTPDDSSAGDLNGRKFYLHQPDAARWPECYELTGPNHADWWLGEGANRKQAVLSEQAGIARYVSTPGTEFKFTLRFRDLRTWELGALWLVLAADQPLIEHFVGHLGVDQARTPKLGAWLNRVASWKPDEQNHPLYALKVGHGRPLGLGSVRVRVKAMCELDFDDDLRPTMDPQIAPAQLDQHRKAAVAALAVKIREIGQEEQPAERDQRVVKWVEQIFVPWLQIHRYAGRKRFDYPRDTARKTNGQPTKAPPEPQTIYNFHTNQRKKHAAGRKLPKGTTPQPAGGLKSLEDLDKEGR